MVKNYRKTKESHWDNSTQWQIVKSYKKTQDIGDNSIIYSEG